MPPPRLYEDLIVDRIVQLIHDNLAAGMGLKTVAIGSMDLFPARETLSEQVPAVFVEPHTTTLERITTAQTYKAVYVFRIVYAKLFLPNEEFSKTRILEVHKIRELLIDNVDLGGLAVPNGQILSSILKATEWKPPEDNTAAMINADLTAVAMNFVVEATSRK